MAKVQTAASPETALPDSGSGRSGSGPSAGFDALIAWIKSQEEANPDMRVRFVLSADPNAPEDVRLRYSRPMVKTGKTEGYEKIDGGMVLFAP